MKKKSFSYGFLITPYFQELQTYGGQSDNYTTSIGQIEKYLGLHQYSD